MDTVLAAESLVVSYEGEIVLNKVDFELIKGEVLSIIGEEGSGKTTLQKAITQQISYEGLVTIRDSQNLSFLKPWQLQSVSVDYLLQGGNVFHNFTVQKHLQRAAGKRDICQEWEFIDHYFDQLRRLKGNLGGTLSGGERIIMSLSAMLLKNADVWILDEPTAGLSPQICDVIKGFLQDMKTQYGKSILLLEHNYDLVFEVSDTVITLKEGTLSRKFEPAEFSGNGFLEKELYGIENQVELK